MSSSSTASTRPFIDPSLPAATTTAAAAATPDASSSSARRKRNAISDLQRLSIRKKRKDEPNISQTALATWFEETHDRKVTQGQISEILSSKWSKLDDLDPRISLTALSASFRTADPMYPDLESALFDWQTRSRAGPPAAGGAGYEARALPATGERITGDMLKAQAAALWDMMPQYRDKPRPAFSNGWLEGYKRRHGLKTASRRSTNGDKAVRQASGPTPAYTAQPGSILHADRQLYSAIAEASRTPLVSLEVPARSGRAFKVPKGGIVRLSCPYGAQVGDLNIWSLNNPRERFWASRTRQLHASHVSTFDRLWSNLPYLRPLCTIITDTLGLRYAKDDRGGRCHDLLGTRCDPYVNAMLSGTSYDFHCHSNLVRAVLPFGLTESDVHDVLNVFQVTGLTKDQGKYWMGTCPATPEDAFEFFAETDLLCALSACPGGDLSVWGFDGEAGRRMKKTCRALRVEVFEMAAEERRWILSAWEEPRPAFEIYKGCHGLGNVPGGEDMGDVDGVDDDEEEEEEIIASEDDV